MSQICPGGVETAHHLLPHESTAVSHVSTYYSISHVEISGATVFCYVYFAGKPKDLLYCCSESERKPQAPVNAPHIALKRFRQTGT